MFRVALRSVACLGDGDHKVSAKLDYLKNTFRWSDAEVRIAVCKAPMVITRSI
jgi:mTERF domain-containing protein